MKLLVQNPQKVYTKEQMYSLIWNDAYLGDENAVNVHISRLRNKIEEHPRSIIIPGLIPIAMKGVKYRPMKAEKMLLRNMGIYGLGGIVVPFVGIKLIDLLVAPLLAMIGM